MKYMALIYTDPALTPEMGAKMNSEYLDFTRRLRDAGAMLAGDALHPISTAPSPSACGRARPKPWTAPSPKPANIWRAST